MTDDLLDRLKEAHRLWRRPLLREAADRIEQLEAALREIMELSHTRSPHVFSSETDYFRIARATLGEKKDD